MEKQYGKEHKVVKVSEHSDKLYEMEYQAAAETIKDFLGNGPQKRSDLEEALEDDGISRSVYLTVLKDMGVISQWGAGPYVGTMYAALPEHREKMAKIGQYDEGYYKAKHLKIFVKCMRDRGADVTYQEGAQYEDGSEMYRPSAIIRRDRDFSIHVSPPEVIRGLERWRANVFRGESSFVSNIDLSFIRYSSETVEDMVRKVWPFLEQPK